MATYAQVMLRKVMDYVIIDLISNLHALIMLWTSEISSKRVHPVLDDIRRQQRQKHVLDDFGYVWSKLASVQLKIYFKIHHDISNTAYFDSSLTQSICYLFSKFLSLFTESWNRLMNWI